MVFGTFDFFHAGHLSFLEQARQHGDHLTVVVARDKTATLVKGEKPIHTAEERMKILEHIDIIDEVTLGGEKDVYAIIRELKPNVIVLGYDQRGFAHNLKRIMRQFGLEIEVVRAKPYRPKSRKSGVIKKKLGLL